MKNAFLKKYQDYCMSKDTHHDIFNMQQHEEESLEDFLERFNYILQKYQYNNLQEDVVRMLFLKGILEEYIEILNLMAANDIYYKPFDEICDLCRKYSCSRDKTVNFVKNGVPWASRSVSTSGITRMEIGNILKF